MQIPDHLKPTLVRILMFQEHHKELLRSLEDEMRQALLHGCGVDINKENWTLDMESGELHRDLPTEK